MTEFGIAKENMFEFWDVCIVLLQQMCHYYVTTVL